MFNPTSRSEADEKIKAESSSNISLKNKPLVNKPSINVGGALLAPGPKVVYICFVFLSFPVLCYG